MKRNENFWSYRLHKLGTPKVLRTDGRTDRRMDGRTDGRTDGRPDGRSGPTTRPAFAKATQVKSLQTKDNGRPTTDDARRAPDEDRSQYLTLSLE